MIRLGHVSVSLELREIYCYGQAVPLGTRAFDILEMLIQAEGRLVTKDQFLAHIWPATVVEENNLQVQISMLRKALGREREIIKTVPGRGYRLTVLPAPEPVSAGSRKNGSGTFAQMMERLGSVPVAASGREARQPPALPVPCLQAPGVSSSGQPSAAFSQPLVYIVDDESSVRIALGRLLRANDIESRTFASAEEFLDEPLVERPACLILDVNLSASSGFDLQDELLRRARPLPIIFMTGYGTIPMSVKAIKAGAQEFLTKPFDEGQLLTAVGNALTVARATQAERDRLANLRKRFEALTPREREVMALLIQGRMNKQIAFELGTREVTAKVHKKHIMTKMRARTLVELLKMCELLGLVSALDKHDFI